MRNFSINLLETVQQHIGKQSYSVERWTSRAPNEYGELVDVYATAESRTGSVQPVERSAYEKFGLTLSAIYVQIYDVDLLKSLERNQNGDRVTFNGDKYLVELGVDWHTQGGWGSVIARRIVE